MIRPEPRTRISPRHRLADFVQARDVDRQNAVPFITGELVDRDTVSQRVDAGIVDQDVDLAVLGDDALNRGGDVVRLGDVEPA